MFHAVGNHRVKNLMYVVQQILKSVLQRLIQKKKKKRPHFLASGHCFSFVCNLLEFYSLF